MEADKPFRRKSYAAGLIYTHRRVRRPYTADIDSDW